MKKFRCIAKDEKGRQYAGSFDANTEEEAREMVRAEGFEIADIYEEEEATKPITVLKHTSWGDMRQLRQQRTEAEEEHLARFRKEQKRRRIGDLLGYVIILTGSLIAISGIFFVLQRITPVTPEKSPKEVVEAYVSLENSGNYRDQFELLGKMRAAQFESADQYAERRKFMSMPAMGKFGGAEEVESERKRVVIEVRALRETGINPVEFHLVLQRTGWKINYVRDPERIDIYLEQLTIAFDADDARKWMQILKGETGLADLKIREMVKAHKKKTFR
ncbi:MAG: hypothetical protein Q8R76_05475 [Candidatus Omnitrophota bacterium]|nr:hypothetical protein [Candidatus Omnitrophota bacterium]